MQDEESSSSSMLAKPCAPLYVSGPFFAGEGKPSLKSYSEVPGGLYEYMFQTNNTQLGELTSPPALLTLCVLVFCFQKFKAWFKPLMSNIGRQMGRKAHGKGWEMINEERILKFGEYCFRLLYHFSIACFGMYAFADKPWWDLFTTGSLGTKNIWLGYPHQPIEPIMQWYYLIQASYKLQ